MIARDGRLEVNGMVTAQGLRLQQRVCFSSALPPFAIEDLR